MKRAIWTSLAWILANSTLVALLVGLEVDINFFHWSPEWSLQSAGCAFGILVLIVFIWYLARITRDKTSLVVSAVACLGLLGIVLLAAAPEPVTTGWLSRPAPSPGWYRWWRVVVGGIPFVCWWVAMARATMNTQVAQLTTPSGGDEPSN